MKKSLIFLFILFSIMSLGGYNYSFVHAEKVYTKNYSKNKKNISFEKNSSRIFFNKRFLPKVHKENLAKKDNWWNKLNFLKIGFYLLVIIGIIVFILFIKYLNLKDADYDDFGFDSEMPIFHPQISEKEYQKAALKADNTDKDLPFEVVWKQSINE